ncbi:MAG: phosphopyruvate hydratase [bacterium]
MKIRSIKALEILDSRGNPTIEATVNLEDGSSGTSAVPSGASTGSHEAVELRDQDEARYHGKGVLHAIKNIEIISNALLGMDSENQEAIDKKMIELDGTENKSKLGANAILAVSLAVASAQAKAEKKPLFSYLKKFNKNEAPLQMPIPMMNVINGGKHANWSTDFQEYMILPIGKKSLPEAIRSCVEVYSSLRQILVEKEYSITVGDEGGFAPAVKSNDEPFELIIQAIQQAGYVVGEDFVLAIDVAASEFYKDGKYILKKENKKLDGAGLLDFYKELVQKYPIVSIEDPFHEDDWESFTELVKALPNKQIVGDDLYATNLERLKKGIDLQASNSILVKPNQIGTLTETIQVIELAKKSGLTTIISHRSGETRDSFIADLAVAMDTGLIKAGAPCRGERTVKYNRLLNIVDQGGYALAKWPF